MGLLDLFRPRWRHSDPAVRKEAVRRLTDQALLARIAQGNNDEEVCAAAVRKLTDQAAVAAVAQSASSTSVGAAAVEKLTDQTLLAQVAQSASSTNVRVAAVESLTDQSLLTQVARSESGSEARVSAVRKLKGRAALCHLAADKDVEVRTAAVFKLGKRADQALLAEIAQRDSDANVRGLAVRNLTDQAALAQVAQSDVEWLRKAAVEKLTDQAALAQVAQNNSFASVRETAMGKLTDQAALAKAKFHNHVASLLDGMRCAVHQARDEMQQLLETKAQEFDAGDLRSLLRLTKTVEYTWRGYEADAIMTTDYGFAGDPVEINESMDCTLVFQLAEQELIRRGEQA